MTSAICCGVKPFVSPHAGILRLGLGPSGVDPCSTKRSTLYANTCRSLLAMVASTGFKDGTVPSEEPGFATLPLPRAPWQGTQFTKTCAPFFESPFSSSAGPGPPGFEGRALSAASVAAVSVGIAGAEAGATAVGIG